MSSPAPHVPAPPSGTFYGWRIVAAVFVTQALSAGLSTYVFGFFQVPIAEEFGVTRSTVALGMAATMLMGAVLGPLFGRALDRRPNRQIMLASGACMAFCYLAMGYTQSLLGIGALFVVGASVGMTGLGPLAASKLVATWFARSRGRALGISSVGTSAGGLIAPPLIAAAILAWGWRGALAAGSAAIVCIALPVIAWTITNRPSDLGLHPDGAPEPPPIPAGGAAQTWNLQRLLRDRNFWVITLVIGTIFATVTGLIANLQPLAVELGADPQSAALLMSLLSFAGIAGKLVFGAVADRFDKRLLVWIGMAVLSIFLLLALSTPSFGMLAAGCVALGFALGGALPLWGALIGDCFGTEAFGEVMGWMGPCMMPLNLTGTLLLPWSFDTYGSYDLALYICLGAIGFAATLLLLLRIPRDA